MGRVRRPIPSRATCDGRHPKTFTIPAAPKGLAGTSKQTFLLGVSGAGRGGKLPLPICPPPLLPVRLQEPLLTACRASWLQTAILGNNLVVPRQRREPVVFV
jgi:hypothetical protein